MAYAAVTSLLRNLTQILRSMPFLFDQEEDIQSLCKDFRFIQSFLENYKPRTDDHESARNLESRTRDLAYAAEDFFDSYIYNCFSPEDWSFPINKELSEIREEMNSIKADMSELFNQNMSSMKVEQDGNSSVVISSRSTPNEEGIFVGFDQDQTTILDRLTGHQSRLEIIPIVGMGGIGKTTLARMVYNHPISVHRFDIRAWVTVSQQYDARKLFLVILSYVTQLTDEINKMSNIMLADKLRKSLMGRRYLIVMDDVWSTETWDDVRRCFVNDNSGSRIVLTTRLKDVALYGSANSSPHHMHFLSVDESWKLLCDRVFVEGSCPTELVKIGKSIAKKCQGLPLAIVVIAGLLSKISNTRESWENVAATVGPQDCLDILALSYNHLPHHLKACFLYMGVFAEDLEIPVWRLIWLWVAEGFLRPSRVKSLEDVAEDYLGELIERSLISVGKRRSNGKVKICRMHDLLRDLCLREGEKENFLYVTKELCGDALVSITKSSILFGRNLQFRLPVPLWVLFSNRIS